MSDGFFITDLDPALTVGQVVTLDGPEGHHAATVRRIVAGERVTVADGQGRGATGVVVQVGKDRLDLRVERLLSDPVPEPRFTCVQALPKNDRVEQTVDLLTEIGVAEIVPWQASRSVVRWQGERGERARERWQSIARAAAKQSRRLTVPSVAPLASTAQVVERLRAADSAYVCHEAATDPVIAQRPSLGDVVVVIGPEGGVAPDELDAFREAGAVAVLIGGTVLRTSTAGTVALVQLRQLAELCHWMDEE
ncbi:MAG: 16S rRNA (uracil(1498)-N(3))-methyltransferase [Actinomycetia bacterium]|nr:16S rRNA (uracil(1498)-N(3))-methyltransferase [Actinomycetes bacterium]